MKHEKVKQLLLKIGEAVCDHVYHSLQHQQSEALSSIVEESEEDTIYAIDKDVEKIILPMIEDASAELGGIRLIAEGIEYKENPSAEVLIIMDPIDGTRGIMYNKRSAFFLAAAAPNYQENLSLSDLELAVMTELPTAKSYVSDSFYAIKGQGASGHRRNLLNQEVQALKIQPSKAPTIIGGFAQISRFFPPGKEILAQIEEELIASLADIKEGKALIFEDQYISSGGQLYELLMGHDRFTADLRPPLYAELSKKGTTTGLCCHPYDVCTFLIGEEAGIIITDIKGNALDVPLNLTYPVCWVAYANAAIQKQVQPVLQSILDRLNWTNYNE